MPKLGDNKTEAAFIKTTTDHAIEVILNESGNFTREERLIAASYFRTISKIVEQTIGLEFTEFEVVNISKLHNID